MGAALLLFVQGSCAQDGGEPTLSQLVGQRILVRIQGPKLRPTLLARIRRGEIGGVIVFGDNFTKPSRARGFIRKLQAAAEAGGQPRLLIAIDQEGGPVKRLPGPPAEAPSEMGSVAEARAQGVATGRYLQPLGIAIDLAPVLDVPASPRAFIVDRAFASDARTVGARGTAFSEGLMSAGVAPAIKHFPGLGRLTRSTDYSPGHIPAGRGSLSRDLAPFRAAIRADAPVVMIGTAIYPALGSKIPAACSLALASKLLRGELGFNGVTMSDDLNTPGVTPIVPLEEAVVRSAKAGVDMIYVSGRDKRGRDAAAAAFRTLLKAAGRGDIPRVQLEASYARVLELKEQFAGE